MSMNLCLGGHDEMYVINLEMVMYFQADDHYSHVFYATGATFMVSFGLSQIVTFITEQYPLQSKFLRLGRKYIVNMSFLFHINTIKQTILLTDLNGATHSLHIAKPVLRDLIRSFECSRNKI
jgi:DNA-binding LytR/AlgR family response regulator